MWLNNEIRFGARGHLKRQGFLIDKRHQQIDRAFIKALNDEQANRVREIWSSMAIGLPAEIELYDVPESVEQAVLLFSHDWPRIEASFEWLAYVIKGLTPQSVLDAGSGAGFLPHFIKTISSSIAFTGVDASENLVRVASQLGAGEFYVGNYLEFAPTTKVDLVVCNFGFDSYAFTPSVSPHSTTILKKQKYCPGCSDDLILQVIPYFQAWDRWCRANTSLALTGRIRNFGEVRAWVLGAAKHGWTIDRSYSGVITSKSIDGSPEKFPALLLRKLETNDSDGAERSLNWIADIY